MQSSKRQYLIKERARLEARIRQINQELEQLDTHPLSPGQAARYDNLLITQSGPELGEFISAVLSEIGFMVTNASIRYLYEARFNTPLSVSQLNRLSEDETALISANQNTVYGLSHALHLENNQLMAINTVWTRQSWPVSQRIFLPTSMRLMNLYFIDWYITNHNSGHHECLSNPLLTTYIEDLVRHLRLDQEVLPPYDSIQSKKITIQEIEKARLEEVQNYSGLAFMITAHYQREKESTLNAETIAR